jgi:prepilin-type N-terminal cleavage/methylation domain-containing protein
MKKSKRRWNQKGFTLIESIISLVLVSIMAVMLLRFTQPLYSGLGAFGSFNDELLLQQSMERILGDYKSQRNNINNPFDPGVFLQYVLSKYSPLVDASRTGFLTFTLDSGTTYKAAWPPQASIPSGAPPVLIITVQKAQGNGVILSMFVILT